MPRASEANGLLALMLLHDARRATSHVSRRQSRAARGARSIAVGSRTDRGRIVARRRCAAFRSCRSVFDSGRDRGASRFSAQRGGELDWRQIAALYALLLRHEDSEVVELNYAVAVAMVDGPAQGLLLVDAIAARGSLRDYHLLHAVRADLLRRLGQTTNAVAAYETALELTLLEPERRFLERRISELRSLDSYSASAKSKT
jgi:RNA polymerase sigma-70 factor (ECF subfamily)